MNDLEKIRRLFLPSKEKIIEAERIIGLPEETIKHCVQVSELALKIADEFIKDGYEVDIGLVEAGALLHDVGIAKVCDGSSPEHGVIGGDIIRKMGLPNVVAMCAETHEFSGGVSYKEALDLQYPIYPLREDYSPKSTEEKIVCLADLFVFLMIEGPEEYGITINYNPWTNLKNAMDIVSYKYCYDVYLKKKGIKVDTDHPILKRAYEINKDLIKYVKPEFLGFKG